MGTYRQIVDVAVDRYREDLEAAIAQAVRAACAEDFTAAERRLASLTQALSSELVRRVVQQVCDDPRRRKEAMERVREKAKGIAMHAMGRRRTPFRTLSGDVVEVTAPYAMAKPRGGKREKRGQDGTGVYPVLDQLGIEGRSTPALRLLVSRALCEANSVTAARELLALGGVAIDHKAALRLTYKVSDTALRAREEAVRTTTTGVPGVLSGRRVAVAVDGGRIQVRRPRAGRPRKGGRRHFTTEWREPKVLTIYVLGEDGQRDRKIPPVIDATLGDADAVFRLLEYHLRRLGGHEAAELVLVGDGAPWIWNRGEALRKSLALPKERYHEIVDYFHVAQRLSDLAKTQHAWRERFRQEWVRAQKQRLKANDVETVERSIEAIGMHVTNHEESEAEYWARNRERMRYGAFKDRGWPRGSGAVESAVRRVVNLRMKGASITWLEEHAEGMLMLRAHAKSGRWDELERTVLAKTGWTPTYRLVRQPA